MFVRPQILRNADVDGSGGAPAPAADPTPATPTADTPAAADAPGADTPAADPATAADPAADPAPAGGKQPWERTRIDQLTREKHEARREVERLKALLEATPKDPAAAPGKGFVPETEVEKRAAALLEQKTFTAKVTAWDKAGRADFRDFTERCNVIAGLGLAPNDKPEFMATIVDMDDGHKLVAHLADHPDEAMELAALPTHRMAMKLAALSTKLAAPKKVSAAPAPVSTPSGVVNPSRDVHDPSLSQEAYAKLRREQRAARRKW
jgi:hypothetical protein